MSPVVKDAPAPDDASPRRGPRGASSEVNTDAAKQAAELGKQLYQQRNFADAVKQFDQSLSYDSGDSNWPAYLGRGSTLLKMGQVKAAISDLEHSRSANAATTNKRDPSILYMLGCAYGQKGDKKQAMDYLRSAVRLGYPLHEYIEGDPDLTRALGDEPQFKELVRKSRERKARGPAGSGSSSP
jgi:tetratricopeptide (TPR) repeat protein